jgi:hypothetical protein
MIIVFKINYNNKPRILVYIVIITYFIMIIQRNYQYRGLWC